MRSQSHFFIAMSIAINSSVVTPARFSPEVLAAVIAARSGTQLTLVERIDGKLHKYTDDDRDNGSPRVAYIVTQNDIDDAIVRSSEGEPE